MCFITCSPPNIFQNLQEVPFAYEHFNMAAAVAETAMEKSSVMASAAEETEPEENSEEWEDATTSDDCDTAGSSNIARFSQRRNMPARASKENSLNKIKRRSIQKPTKRNLTKALDFSSLRPADIKKIYLNKKITNFRPSNLETIFEEEDQADNEADAAEPAIHATRLIGARKLKRSLSCSDGVNINKTLIKQRRARIKKAFGRRFALKKISLEDFMTQFNVGASASHVEDNGALEIAAAAEMKETALVDQ